MSCSCSETGYGRSEDNAMLIGILLGVMLASVAMAVIRWRVRVDDRRLVRARLDELAL